MPRPAALFIALALAFTLAYILATISQPLMAH